VFEYTVHTSTSFAINLQKK